MTTRQRLRPGFTLVELLTVIAIIAILAAIIFPVFSVVRKNVHKAQCTSNLHSIAQAIKMYKDDYRLYPDALYGYQYPTGSVRLFLYPNYVKDKSGFRCPLNPKQLNSQDIYPGYNGILKSAVTAYGTNSPVAFLAWDSYDGSVMPPNTPNAQYVVHYLRKFTPVSMGAADEPRQLIYRNPPDNTVVTWCTYHRDWSSGQPQQGSMDLVLYLDGRVKPVSVTQTADELRAHSVTPSS